MQSTCLFLHHLCKSAISCTLLGALDYTNSFKLTLEGISLKKLHEGKGGGGWVLSLKNIK